MPENVERRTLRIEALHAGARILFRDVENAHDELMRRPADASLLIGGNILKDLLGDDSYAKMAGERNEILDRYEDARTTTITRLRHRMDEIQRFISKTRPEKPNVAVVAGKIKAITGLPEDALTSAHRTRFSTELLEGGVVVRFLPGPSKGNRPQAIRPAAVAAGKAMRGFQEAGFRVVPTEEPHGIVVVMPRSGKITEKELDQMDRMLVGGMPAICRKRRNLE